ncbi:trigger factor [Pontibacter sp. JAM-7]|uniref:trigger factor n=1 Tax=Pontibacter sp. JAM-7 TaxID=3366581 RepID=UPI003AF65B16
MQVSVETTSGLERLMTVSVPAERIDQDVNKRIQQTARTVRLDGFRPGKVPVKVVKQRYGKGIREEVLGQVVQETFYAAVQQEKLNPAGGPSIDVKKEVEGEDFEYTATFEVYPEIALSDFSAVSIEKKTAEIVDADLDKMIDTLRKQQASWAEVERAAASGDRVKMDFEGFVDGEAFEGGKAEDFDLVLGSGQMIPGFEDALEGVTAGTETEINVTFPEQYQSEQLQGKPATFKIVVKSVSEQQLPELNDEFFGKFGLDELTEEAFRAEVRNNMERELKQALKMKLKDQVFSKLIEANSIDVPASLIDGEIDVQRRQAVEQFGGKDSQMDPNSLPKELFTAQAERRVSIGLLLQEVIKANSLEAEDSRVRETLEEMAETYQDPQQVIDWYMSNEQMLNQIKGLVLEDQVVDLLLGQAQVTDVTVSYEDAIKPEQPAAPAQEETEAAE